MAFEFRLPDIGEGIVEGEIVHWFVEEGDQVEEDQSLVEIMTDKATVELPSPRDGKVLKRIGEEGETVEVGATLVIIQTDDPETEERVEGEPTKEDAPEKPRRMAEAVKSTSGIALATPAIRKLAQERGVDLDQVEGSGPEGRITKEDVEHVARFVPDDTSETIAYRGLRKKIGDRMVASKRNAAHYTYVEEADLSELVRRREEWLASNPAPSVRITYLPFIMKAVVGALKQYPLLNSVLDESAGVIQLKKYYNIGIAVATADGLVVPVVKRVDEKTVSDLAREVGELSAAARDRKIKLEDLRGGTFTITSLGRLGGILATPIINHPEVAILGVHKISRRPVVREGEIVIRDMVYLSLSLDHRVLDGVVGAEFLHHVMATLESPGAVFEAI